MTAADDTITLKCGATYWAQFVNTDLVGNPVTITSPKMEIRVDALSTSTLLYTSEGGSPTIIVSQPTPNQVIFTIHGSVTKNETAVQTGYWDAFAVDPDGEPVLLGQGIFVTELNVTSL